MKNLLLVLLSMAVVLSPGAVNAALKAVDWQVINTLDLPATSRDLAVAADGRLYLLTDDGHVKIVAADGSDLGRIEVGGGADRIFLGPGGERLYVSDRNGRQLKIISLADVVDIPLNGSPFRGPAEAAITVVVFSDFQ